MDDKLKEAIAKVRQGETKAAQRQLTELLEDNPEQVQGWYLLSMLVKSPQKQAAYLSKTLALNPQHEKAKKQLAALEAEGALATTAAIDAQRKVPLDVIEQSESDELPDWLASEGGTQPAAAAQDEPVEETAVANETLPDWLKEPSDLDAEQPQILEEESTDAGQTAESTIEPDKVVANLEQTVTQSTPKPTKAAHSTPQNSWVLNITLSILVILALVVIVLLAYLLLS